jgi:transcriptional regulator with XRE-family HTH domain
MKNEVMAKVLKEYRKKNHFSVPDVALRLHEQNIEVATKTIYGWESGQAHPSADMLLTLCELYNITDILSAFGYREQKALNLTITEQRLIESYRVHPELQEAINILLLSGRRVPRKGERRPVPGSRNPGANPSGSAHPNR